MGAKYYINQKFSIRDRFTVKDEEMNDVFYAEGKFLTIGKKIRLHAMDGDEVLYIEEKVLSFLSNYKIYIGNQLLSEVKQELAFFKKKYNIVTPNWHIRGDVWSMNFDIVEGSEPIATIRKKWFSFMDAYEIEVFKEDYLELILGVVIVIDADLEKDAQAAANS